MAVENMQGDAKVSSANEHRKTSAGASQADRTWRELERCAVDWAFRSLQREFEVVIMGAPENWRGVGGESPLH